MNRTQARQFVTETFTHAFDKARFRNFVLNVVNHLDESKAQQWNTAYVKDAFKAHVHRYERLGTYTSPGKETLDVLVVYLTTESKLERARTSIRNFVADHLKARNEKDAALVAFVSPSENTWRFSYVKMEYATVAKESGKVGVETKLTPARRFSYIVGEGESCHTAQTRFLNLLGDTGADPLLASIEEAFSVEAVTKEFFTKYAELFGQINSALEDLADKDKAIRNEFASKNVNTVDFAKKLMGQIVFLYFLQKKGWLGVAKGKDWGSGPHDLLRKLAGGEYGKHHNFFNDILEPLFYDTLATDRGHEAWCDRFKCRIPFLNGGLFEPLGGYNWSKIDVHLPNRLFTNSDPFDEGVTGTGVLDVFDRYNFTVNEAEPLEKEVAIDPEMLGKVFENLIEDNRRRGLGAYYTPREIVHYMCQESLINYLDTALNSANQLVPRADIETFIHLGEQISHYEAVEAKYVIKMPKSVQQSARLLDDKLADITVCDPAVGSGAFPVGMMTEIVRGRCTLTPYFNDYHERTPYHFKRHAIQNCLYGVDIDAGAVEIAKLRLWLSLVVDEEEIKQIKPLPNLDFKIVSGNSLFGVAKTLFNNQLFDQLERLKPLYFDESDAIKKANLRREISDLIHQLTRGKEIFDFEIYFSEVFHKQTGFDIVIANPPYVFTRGSDFTEEFKRMAAKDYVSGKGKINLFSLFIEKAGRLLTENGVFAYIIPNTFFRATSYAPSRELIVKTQRLLAIVDLHAGVFEGVTASTTVIIVQRQQEPNPAVKFLGELPNLRVDATLPTIDQSHFRSPGFVFAVYLYDASRSVFEKMSKDSVRLEYLCLDIIEGIVTPKGKNDFIADSPKTAKYKPFLEGKDVGRYRIEWRNKYIHFDRKILHRPRPDYVWESNEKILIRRIGGGATALFATLDSNQFYTFASINNLILKPQAAIEYRCLLALLNSRLLNWFYVEQFTNRSELTVNISRTFLDQLPIKVPSSEQRDNLVSLVNRILKAKGRNAAADTSGLEQQIDSIVYEVYGLTSTDVQVVEGNTGLQSAIPDVTEDDGS